MSNVIYDPIRKEWLINGKWVKNAFMVKTDDLEYFNNKNNKREIIIKGDKINNNMTNLIYLKIKKAMNLDDANENISYLHYPIGSLIIVNNKEDADRLVNGGVAEFFYLNNHKINIIQIDE